jgi:cell division protein FtsB
MDPITITLTLLALKTVLGGKTAVSADPKVANAQQQLAEASALNTKIQQEVAVLKQQAEQAKRDYENANDLRIKNEAKERTVEAQRQRDEGLRVQAESAKVVVNLQQQLAAATQAVQRSGEERRDEKEAAFQREMALKAAASKTVPVTITKSVTSRDLNRN